MPNTEKVSRGDPIKIEAATYNTMLEAADDFARRRRSGREPSPSNDPHVGATLGLVRWDGGALPEGSVVGYGAAVIAPADDPHSVRRRYVWVGTTPASESDPFAITVEPTARAGEYARAAVLGQTVVDIDVTDEAHTHAVPIVGDTTKLASATSGPTVILSKPAGTGVLRCGVLLGSGGGESCCSCVGVDVQTESLVLDAGNQPVPTPLTGYVINYQQYVDVPGDTARVVIGAAYGQSSNGISVSQTRVRMVAFDPTSGAVVQALTGWAELIGPYTNTGTGQVVLAALVPAHGGSAYRVGFQYHVAASTAGAVFVGGYPEGWLVALPASSVCSNSAATSPTPPMPPPPAPALVASFDHTPKTGPVALAVAFTDTSTGTPTAWAWDFGDGSGSTAQHPSHVYQVIGTYNVSLTASNASGSSLARGVVVVYRGGPPDATRPLKAAVALAAAEGVAPFRLVMQDATDGGVPPLVYRVNYGDGATSGALTALPSTHDYASAGTYAVTVTVEDSVGSVSAAAKTIAVVAPADSGDGSLTASFTQLGPNFTDTSTGTPTAWAWDFGDGFTSTDQNPTHFYLRAGLFTVRLTVSHATDSDTVTQEIAYP